MKRYEEIVWKPQGERTAVEKAIVEKFVRSHNERAAAKAKEAATKMATARKAAAKKAGSNMKRYEEILRGSRNVMMVMRRNRERF